MSELSIVIPTLNRGRVLHQTIMHVLAQDHSDFELIIVDQSDAFIRDENEIFVRSVRDTRVRYLFVHEKNLPNARNFGIVNSVGKFILFLDDDVVLLSSDFLDAHIRAFDDPAVAGVTGRTIERAVVWNSRRTTMHVTVGGRTIINLAGTKRQSIQGLKGANMSFRAEIFTRVGGFDRNYTESAILEDVDMATRIIAAGWKISFEPRAELLHLSAPEGGVRVAGALKAEHCRFRLTGYFIAKTRGPGALAPFFVTFSAIALVRALRFGKLAVCMQLLKSGVQGVQTALKGPDQGLNAAATALVSNLREEERADSVAIDGDG